MDLNNDCALLTAADIHAVDAHAAQQGISPQQLMHHAGQALTTAILQRFPRSRTLIVCGPGNNGGDGFVLARLLAAREWPVFVCCEHGGFPTRVAAYERVTRD